MVQRRRTLGIVARREQPPPPLQGDLGGAFFSIAKFFGDLKDKEDAKLGTEQGAAAALANSLTINGEQIPTFKRVEGTGPFGAAFNKSGLAVYGARMELTMREKARELSVKHRLNPAAMQSEMDRFITGLKAAAPPEFKALFELQGAKLIGPRVDASIGRLFALKAKDTAATLDALLLSTTADAQELAGQVTDGGPGAQKALGLIASGTKTYLDKVVNAIDGQTFTAGMARERIVNYQSEVAKRVLMGMFDGSDDKADLFTRFVKGELNDKITMDIPVLTDKGKIEIKKNANIIGMMTPKALKFVRAYMGLRVKDIASAAKHTADVAAEKLKVERDIIANDFLNRSRREPGTAPLTYADVLASNLTLEKKKTFLKILDDDLTGKGERETAIYNELFVRIGAGITKLDTMIDDVLPFVGNGITAEDYKTLQGFAKILHGEKEGRSLKNFLNAAKAQITQTTLIQNDPAGDSLFFDFTERLNRRIEEERAKGIPLRELMNPQSKEYLGPMIKDYLRTPSEQIRDMADRLRGTPRTPGIPRREPGENMQEFRKRITPK